MKWIKPCLFHDIKDIALTINVRHLEPVITTGTLAYDGLLKCLKSFLSNILSSPVNGGVSPKPQYSSNL